MPSRHFIVFNEKENKVAIYDEDGDCQFSSGIGETMLGFLELNLSDYDRCRTLISDYVENDYDKKIRNKIIKSYPKTYSYMLDFYKESINDYSETYFDFIDSNKDIANITDVYMFPYIYYSETYQFSYFEGDWSVLEYDFNFAKLQNIYSKLIAFCFDTECQTLNKLNTLERFYLFQIKEGVSYFYNNKLNYSQIIFPALSYKDKAFLKNKKIDNSLIEYMHNLKPFQITALECTTPKDMAFYELFYMLKLDIKMKKCKNCGNYFILKGDYNTDYCDRILPGEKFTCKKLAAIKARKNKINNNPILREYEKAYKRNYARRTNHKMDEDNFIFWVDEATQKRDEALEKYAFTPNENIVIDFKKYLGNK